MNSLKKKRLNSVKDMENIAKDINKKVDEIKRQKVLIKK